MRIQTIFLNAIRQKRCCNPCALLCRWCGTGNRGFCRRFLFLSKKSGFYPKSEHIILWRFLYGRECEDTESGKTRYHGGWVRRLSDGTYVDVRRIEEVREQYEDVAVVCYVNSTAEIKAHSDVCVTSSNALRVVKALPNKRIFFIPDNNLGRYVASKLPEKEFIFHDGYCHVHKSIHAENVKEAKGLHPDALVLTHPECTWDVLELSDFIGSTSEIIDYATASDHDKFIICTEMGVFYELQQKNPQKKILQCRPSPVLSEYEKDHIGQSRAGAYEYGTGNVCGRRSKQKGECSIGTNVGTGIICENVKDRGACRAIEKLFVRRLYFYATF